jgi:hypothetical protein
MMLIESVIEGPWLNNGGTATMFPFRQGVRIDPQGLIQRLDETQGIEDLPSLRMPPREVDRTASILTLEGLGEWQHPSRLRWVSLHQLDEQLTECRQERRAANIAMEMMGGLCRIDYVAFDSSCGEWLLGGPAGSIVASPEGDLLHNSLHLPPILLEDVLSIAPHVLQQKGEFGCSIDPVHERLVAAYKMAQSPTSLRDLRSDPEYWASQWKSQLGRQRANIIGVPEDSPTGFALLLADAHMKRIALGLERAPEGLNNYWLEADTLSQTHKGPMVRWWFTLSDARIPWDPTRRIAHFELSNVRVLSESQMINTQGERVATDKQDWAADGFARNFTSKFEALQREYPVYGRLRHIFDLAVALEIVRTQIQAGHGKPFHSLQRLDLQPHLPVAPREIDSVVATRRSSDGAVSAIVSGGVSISPLSTAPRMRRSVQAMNAIIVEASPGQHDDRRDEADGVQGEDKPFWR